MRTAFLLAGVLAGLALAMASLLRSDDAALPDFAIARVGDHFIPRASWERAVEAVRQDRRDPGKKVDDRDRRRILERLIDEELLLQYGIRRGFVRSDAQARSALVQSVMLAHTMEAEAMAIDDDEARAFFEENESLFATTARVRVGLLRVPEADGRTLEEARARADEAARELRAGRPFADVAAEYHEGGALALPDAPLPRTKLTDYLGPSLAEAALALQPGQASQPLLLGRAWQVLFVHERQIAPAPAFDDVAELVRAEMRRRHSERSVRRLLDSMRDTEDVVVGDLAADTAP